MESLSYELQRDAAAVKLDLERTLRPDRTTLAMIGGHTRVQIARLAAAWEAQADRTEAAERGLEAARAIRAVSASQPVLTAKLRALHAALVALGA
jgi:hypothetical protein